MIKRANLNKYVKKSIEQALADGSASVLLVRCLSKMLENGDKDIRRALSFRVGFIISDDDIKGIVNTLNYVADNYVFINSARGGSAVQEDGLNTKEVRKVIEFRKRS